MADNETRERLAQALANMIVVELAGAPLEKYLDGFKQGRETGDILPRPVKCDGNGILTADYSTREWYEKIMEEVLEAYREAVVLEIDGDYDVFPDSVADEHMDEAEELMDIITVCTSRLAAIGYDTARAWHNLARAANAKNGERGYFDD